MFDNVCSQIVPRGVVIKFIVVNAVRHLGELLFLSFLSLLPLFQGFPFNFLFFRASDEYFLKNRRAVETALPSKNRRLRIDAEDSSRGKAEKG